MSYDLHAVKGSSVDEVTTNKNYPSAPDAHPIFTVDPTRGTFLKFLNRVAKGDLPGMPVYAKLRDTNGNDLPANTELYWAAKVAGGDDRHKVSEKKRNISFYNANSITVQQDVDNVDGAKFVLEYPEASSQNGARSALPIRDIDSLSLMCDSSAQIDWAQSELYIDTAAVEQGEVR